MLRRSAARRILCEEDFAQKRRSEIEDQAWATLIKQAAEAIISNVRVNFDGCKQKTVPAKRTETVYFQKAADERYRGISAYFMNRHISKSLAAHNRSCNSKILENPNINGIAGIEMNGASDDDSSIMH